MAGFSPAASAATTPASDVTSSITKLAIKAGGSSLVVGHTTWIRDQNAIGGRAISTQKAISGTSADELFQRARVGMQGYDIPVGTSGTFSVTFKFAEIEGRSPGQRVFAVDAEGRRSIDRVDIAAATGQNRAMSITRTVQVRDGDLDLSFPASRGEALVSGIAVRRHTPIVENPVSTPAPVRTPVSTPAPVSTPVSTPVATPAPVSSPVSTPVVTPSPVSTPVSTPAPVSTPVSTPAPVSSSDSGIVRRSGLAWASGVYLPGGQPSVYENFGTWRGSKIDVATMWTARANWNDIVNPGWLYRTWAGTPTTKILGIPPFPEDGSTVAACANGSYDSKWTEFARNIKAAGMDDEAIIRLGWEFNGNWYTWSAYNPDQFASCWRHVYNAAEAVAPALRWDWNVNRGAGQSVADARKAYPGDQFVDIVGVDAYDIWPGATNAANWDTQLNGAYGLKFWLDFAISHGKRLSVPEWGVYPGTAQAGHNGGDNAYYIQKMHDFFADNAANIAYESYFNESDSYYAGSIFGPVQNPKASAAYQAAF